jgi:predicted SnoaL-like aldol condensation-catalyzing enzyme
MKFVLLFAICLVPLAAQDAEHPATKPQGGSAATAQEKKNLQLVTDWWVQVIQGHHVDLYDKYQPEDFIEHSPNFGSGKAAFVKGMSAQPPANPMPKKLNPAPVVTFARGDYVTLIWQNEAPEPADPSKKYLFNTFDVVRVQNGKIVEHWDSDFKEPSSQVPPSLNMTARKTVGAETPEEKKNLDIAMKEFKDMLQYGHLELAEKYLAPTYIQHNPNVPGARDGFVKFMSRNRTPEPIKDEWKNPPTLVVTAGPYVMFMRDTKAKDPVDPTKEYVRDHFDIVRIENGMIAEHWDEAKKAAPVATQAKQ